MSTLGDPVLGELTRIDDFAHFRLVTIAGESVRLVIETGEGLTPEATAQARQIVSAPDALAERARSYAREHLVVEEDEPTPTLDLEEIEVAPNGVASFYFGDGGAFGGHSVVVYVGREGLPVDAKLAG